VRRQLLDCRLRAAENAANAEESLCRHPEAGKGVAQTSETSPSTYASRRNRGTAIEIVFRSGRRR